MGKEDAKPMRTFLFVAGSDEDEVKRAAGHGADAVVVDLEEPRTPYPEDERKDAPSHTRLLRRSCGGCRRAAVVRQGPTA